MNEIGNNALSKPITRVCALQYRHPNLMSESTPGLVMLVAIRDDTGLSLYVPHSLMQQISERDKAYIKDLLMDLTRRSKVFPDETFEQLSNLSIGPIVTDAVGFVQPGEFSIEKAYPGFARCL